MLGPARRAPAAAPGNSCSPRDAQAHPAGDEHRHARAGAEQVGHDRRGLRPRARSCRARAARAADGAARARQLARAAARRPLPAAPSAVMMADGTRHGIGERGERRRRRHRRGSRARRSHPALAPGGSCRPRRGRSGSGEGYRPAAAGRGLRQLPARRPITGQRRGQPHPGERSTSRLPPRAFRWAPGRGRKGGPLVGTEPERLDQHPQRVPPWSCPDSSFQVADAASAQACPLGQGFLRQPRGDSVLVKQLTEARCLGAGFDTHLTPCLARTFPPRCRHPRRTPTLVSWSQPTQPTL